MTLQALPCAMDDLLVGRRVSQRHRLDLTARLSSTTTSFRVQLEDLSSTGACVRLQNPQPIAAGQLHWLGFAAYGRVVWNDGIRCGLVFDEPLSDACLKETVEFAHKAARDPEDRFLRLASAWVHGPGDW